MLGLIIPEGWPPRWHRWYRPIRKRLCRVVGHHTMFVDAPYLVCLWCDAAIPYPTEPEIRAHLRDKQRMSERANTDEKEG